MTGSVLRRAPGPLLPLLLLALVCVCGAAELPRPSYANQPRPSYADIAAGNHKKPGYVAAAPAPAHAPAPSPVNEAAVAQAVTQFSLNVAKDVIGGADGNVVVSPLGVAHLLSLLQQAAAPFSDTEAQLEKGLLLDKESSSRGIPQLLRNAITKPRSKSVLENGNSLFVNAEWRLKPDFLGLAHSTYDMDVASLDFKQADAAVAAINKWASDATHGHIPALVSKGSVNPRTNLVLASAMYFRGVWQRQFDVGKTVQRLFSVSPAQNATVFMMQQAGDYRFGELSDLGAQWLEIPFDGEHFSMLVLLPNQRHGADEVLQRLQAHHIQAMVSPSPPRRAILLMPRFQISTDAGLTHALKNLGIHSLFGRDAKLRGISDNVLSVSDVVHKAQMKVDEQGAVASAASAVLVNTLSLINFSDDMRFNVDHPFLAIIVDRTTKLPLFISRVAYPDRSF